MEDQGRKLYQRLLPFVLQSWWTGCLTKHFWIITWVFLLLHFL